MHHLYNKAFTRLLGWLKPTMYFLHIGKTGGTSIIESGIGQPELGGQSSYTILDKLGWKFDVQSVPHWRVPNVFLHQKNLAFFIRNPLSRLESIFYYEKNYRHSEYNIEQSAEISAIFNQFEYFETWFYALQKSDNPEHKASLELFTQVEHFQRGYSFYFKDKESVLNSRNRITFIGEQENFNEDIGRLLTTIGIKNKERIQHRNKSKRPKANEAVRRIHEHEARSLLPKEYEIYDALLQLKKELHSHSVIGKEKSNLY